VVTPRRLTQLGGCLAIVLFGGGAVSAVAADPPAITVVGNQFVAGGAPIRLIGVDRSGTEYSCAQDDGIFVGPTDQASVDALLDWDVNAVMLPLNEACWLGNYENAASGPYSELDPSLTGVSYQQAIESYVQLLNANGIYVVLDLLGAAPGNNVFAAPGARTSSQEIPMADADHSPAFWTSVAGAFKTDGDVLFHLYDEPNGDVGWMCLRDGCTADDAPDGPGTGFGSYTAAGDQTLVTAVRDAGATQPILLSGIDFDGDLSMWPDWLPTDPANQLGAVLDSFDYSGNFDDQQQNMIDVAAGHPLLIGGFGESACSAVGPGSFADGLMDFADAHAISYMAWTWDTLQDYGGCTNNALLDDGTGAPDSAYDSGNPSFYGADIQAHFQALAAESTSTSSTTTSSTTTSSAATSTTTASGAPPSSTTTTATVSTAAVTGSSTSSTVAAEPSTTGPATARTPAAGRLSVRTAIAGLTRAGTLPLVVRCLGTGGCRGSFRLVATVRRRGWHTESVTIAIGDYAVAPGAERALTLRPTRGVAALLRAQRSRLDGVLRLRNATGALRLQAVTIGAGSSAVAI